MGEYLTGLLGGGVIVIVVCSLIMLMMELDKLMGIEITKNPFAFTFGVITTLLLGAIVGAVYISRLH